MSDTLIDEAEMVDEVAEAREGSESTESTEPAEATEPAETTETAAETAPNRLRGRRSWVVVLALLAVVIGGFAVMAVAQTPDAPSVPLRPPDQLEMTSTGP